MAFSIQAVQSFIIAKLPKHVHIALRRQRFNVPVRRFPAPASAFETSYNKNMINQKLAKRFRKQELRDMFNPSSRQLTNVERDDLTGDFGKQVEAELKHIAMKWGSELEKTPYLETKGKKDYLVMKDQDNDPYIETVPNDIYYQQEKKCVNWFEGCANNNGLATQLLQKVYSPYK